jgi:hypothetical protein
MVFAAGRHLSLVAGVEVVLPALRPGFDARGVGMIYRVPAVGGRGHVGLEVRFP